MPNEGSASVNLVPTAGWDRRILVCGYDLAYAGCVLPMHVFVIVSERYVVIVDTLVNAATAQELLEISQPHLAGRQLLIVNTHADHDHAWGNQLFAAGDSAAPIVGTRACAARLRSQEERRRLAQLRSEQPHIYADVELCPPNIRFDDSLAIDGGDLTLELFATPGHTPDHCSVYIPEIGALLVGDAAEAPFPSPDENGLIDLRASLARLDNLGARAAFYCHAPVDAGPELIRENREYFDRLEDRCRAALDGGASSDPGDDVDVEELIGFSYEEALPPGGLEQAPERYYRPGHRAAIRAMLRLVSLA